jgi:hypothetical protein
MSISRDITLTINQESLLDFSTPELKLKFLSVVEDSRCPVGVDCIWEGNAKVRLQISLSETNDSSEIFELNTNLEPRSVQIEDYQIEFFNLTPKPKVDLKIEPENYIAIFSITNPKIVTEL